MIEWISGGNILDAECPIANPVNCLGVSGAGLAYQIAKRWPVVNHTLLDAARSRRLCLGRIEEIAVPEPVGWILCVPTKRDWRNQSQIRDVGEGILALRRAADRLRLSSIAIPQLGCGRGGLDWRDVRPLVMEVFTTWHGTAIVYGPRPASH